MFANCRSQFLLDRLGRCIKLVVSTDSTSCEQFEHLYYYTRKTHENNSYHSGERLNQNGEKATSQIGDNESLYLHDMKNVF